MALIREDERQRLLALYRKAPEAEQTLIKFLALAYAPLNKGQIINGLRKHLGAAQVAQLNFDDLLKKQFILSEAFFGNPRFYCNPLISNLIARELADSLEIKEYVKLLRLAAPLQKSYWPGVDMVFTNEGELIREVRIGVYCADVSYVEHIYKNLEKMRGSLWAYLSPSEIFAKICIDPFDKDWFVKLPEPIIDAALPAILLKASHSLKLDADIYALFIERCRGPIPENWRLCLARMQLLRGELDSADQNLALCSVTSHQLALRALLLFLRNDVDGAILLFREALAQHKKERGKRKAFLPELLGYFHLLALLQRNRPGDYQEAHQCIELMAPDDPLRSAFMLLAFVPALERDDAESLKHLMSIVKDNKQKAMPPWSLLLGLVILRRYQAKPAAIEALAADVQASCEASGFAWPAAEFAALIAESWQTPGEWSEKAKAYSSQTGQTLLVDRIHHVAHWERALDAIKGAMDKPLAEVKDGAGFRLAWLISQDRGEFSVEAREQKKTASGVFGKGKVLSLKRVLDLSHEPAAYFTEQDCQIAAHIGADYPGAAYQLSSRGWLMMIGHPLVFWKNSSSALELCAGEPELRVRRKGDKIKIEFWPKVEPDSDIVLAQDGLTRLKVIEIKPEHQKLASIIADGIEAPEQAQERILGSLSSVSALVTIHSDIGGEFDQAEMIPADPRLRVQLLPEGEGLRAVMLVRPFGDQGSYYVPGEGGKSLMAEIAGKRLQTLRDLENERDAADELVDACPSLGRRDDFQWLLEDAERSLELLLELHQVQDKALIEWPQGEKLKILGQGGLSQFSMKLKQSRDWFSISGELKLDNGQVLDMQRLMALTEGSKSKFIRLDEGHFIALTDAFRKRLDDMRSFSEKHGKDLRIHALALPVFDEISTEVGEFDGDLAWCRQLEKLRQAEQVKAVLPSTLQAELRDYQLDGFHWLSRLAAWGVGACLADDMGLGKTVQSLGLILSRAALGPTLVVAPTSVCFNWHSEAQRFAPSLNVQLLGGGDRQKQIQGIGPMDLLICSYALLQQESVADLLIATDWQTIILDEAQFIKNAATKRSQQAMALQGRFKMITTGTPVENHLGELWNLFRFINPGLLGSLESFNRRFAGPIERDKDREARHRLKRLLQPFILRRTKAQVLDELPPRTEIDLQVELSEAEAVFYEALRRKLLNEISEAKGPEEDKRFKVLAAITKLRRACCNAALAAPDIGLPSSKLALFAETLGELLENRHKALVFSQFVDHLSLIRNYLDEKGIVYQYLDGQTPAAERKKRVEAFQAGEGDVFLISLRAGGVGLNLTAADYVIHMDPWWNPAVEDQASDRAHRIGQQRPVTVYRLVTQNTIEEQIVSLHRHKRDLADSVLEGGEISGKISSDDLLSLIRGE